jgi:diguanylate cyclase (GGDEF)-like protein/PAS domain S-box-containing protein
MRNALPHPQDAAENGLRSRNVLRGPQIHSHQAWQSNGQAFCAVALATVAALRLIGSVDRAMLLWPVSGVALAMALRQWSTDWKNKVPLLLAVASGFWLTACALGMRPVLASMIAAFTCIDVLIGGAILGRSVRCFDDLKHQANIGRFLFAAVAVPLLTGLAGAYPVAHSLRDPVLQTGLMNVFSNSLGIAIFLPGTLLLMGDLRAVWHSIAAQAVNMTASAAIFLSALSFVFWQTTNPFLFMVFPPMILVLLVWGLEGALFTSIAVLVIGWIATLHHHGPIYLARGTTPLQHLLLFQGFAWICMATAMPVGALLDERRRADHDLKEAQSVYRVLLQHTQDLIVFSALDGSQRYVSPAITRMTGWTPEEYLAMERGDTVHPDEREFMDRSLKSLSAENPEYAVRYRMRLKSGDWLWVEGSIRAYGIEGETIAGYVGTIRDITTLKEAEETWQRERRGLTQENRHMASLANTDPLTGLLNRRGLTERLRHHARRSDRLCSVLMIDVDYFKRYNDTYGHPAGDRCLVALAELLKSHTARRGDLVARLGGEEFGVVLAGATIEEALQVGERMRRAMLAEALAHSSSPFGLVTISIGATGKNDDDDLDLDLLLARADTALYRSKRSRNCVSACADDAEVPVLQVS